MLIPVRMLEEKHGEKPEYPGFSIEPKSNNEKSGGPSEMGGSVRHGHQCPPIQKDPAGSGTNSRKRIHVFSPDFSTETPTV